jgi:hypothetical protein
MSRPVKESVQRKRLLPASRCRGMAMRAVVTTAGKLEMTPRDSVLARRFRSIEQAVLRGHSNEAGSVLHLEFLAQAVPLMLDGFFRFSKNVGD